MVIKENKDECTREFKLQNNVYQEQGTTLNPYDSVVLPDGAFNYSGVSFETVAD